MSHDGEIPNIRESSAAQDQRDLRVDLSGPTSLATIERREGDGTWYGRVYMRPDGTLYLRPIVEDDDA